ncbi:hypothetical protein ACLOJK_027559 [Asimina triloba]
MAPTAVTRRLKTETAACFLLCGSSFQLLPAAAGINITNPSVLPSQLKVCTRQLKARLYACALAAARAGKRISFHDLFFVFCRNPFWTHGRMERNIIEGGSGGEAVIGTNGQYSGSNRKFVASNLPTTSKIAKSEGMKVEAKTNNPASGEIDHNREDFAVKSSTAEHQRPNERYPDIVDIAGMDYSPAKRKPPIHN